MPGSSVVIVGAGPVGSLLALTLARRGIDVDVYERRPDMRKHDIGGGRSINLAVSTRGLHALHSVDLDEEVLAQAVPMRGRMMHSLTGELSFLRYGRDDSEFINSMSRGDLNKLLMDSADQATSGRVRFAFRRRLISYDFETTTAVFHDEETREDVAVIAPVIIGSDGSASALRASMHRTGGLALSEDTLEAGYKELTLPSVDGGFAFDRHALHIWPRGRFMLIALPNRDGSFTCTLFLAFDAPSSEPSFAQLTDPRAVRAFFERYFVDVTPLFPNLEEAFLAAPLGRMATVKCQPWARDGALLIGDAAHAIVPFFGQGMNAGFEDCSLLDAVLGKQAATYDWASIFEAFARERVRDTDAIADLAVENFAEMRDRVADPGFLLQRSVETEIQRRFPGRYLTRYQLVTFSRVPYKIALDAGRVQAEMLRELCVDAKSAGDVDYQRADTLLRQRLEPLLRAAGVLN